MQSSDMNQSWFEWFWKGFWYTKRYFGCTSFLMVFFCLLTKRSVIAFFSVLKFRFLDFELQLLKTAPKIDQYRRSQAINRLLLNSCKFFVIYLTLINIIVLIDVVSSRKRFSRSPSPSLLFKMIPTNDIFYYLSIQSNKFLFYFF